MVNSSAVISRTRPHLSVRTVQCLDYGDVRMDLTVSKRALYVMESLIAQTQVMRKIAKYRKQNPTKRHIVLVFLASLFLWTSSVMGTMTAQIGLTKDLIGAIAVRNVKAIVISTFVPMEVDVSIKHLFVMAVAIALTERMRAPNTVTVSLTIQCFCAVKEVVFRQEPFALRQIRKNICAISIRALVPT